MYGNNIRVTPGAVLNGFVGGGGMGAGAAGNDSWIISKNTLLAGGGKGGNVMGGGAGEPTTRGVVFLGPMFGEQNKTLG